MILLKPFEEKYVDWWLSKLQRDCIIERTDYDKTGFETLRTIVREVFAGPKKSSISPVEERLIYAVSNIQKPKTVTGVGSYFGHAMAWIVPNIDPEGKAYLIDPDPAVSETCKTNFETLGLTERVEVIAKDFFDIAQKLPKTDFVWIDAYGPRKNPPELRGKRIYGPIIERINKKIEEGGIVVAHNVINTTARQVSQTGCFKRYINENFEATCYILTRNGISVSKK